jgi:HK97 family phage portal protein
VRSGLRKVGKAFAKPQNATGVPIPYASGFYGLSALPGYNQDDTFLRAYSSNGTIYSIVSLFAEATAGVEWSMYRKNKKDGRVRYTTADRGSDQRIQVVKHPALDLWNHPNKFMPGFTFRETFQTQFELTGKAFWVLDIGEIASLPLGMWPISPARIEAVPSDRDFIAGWVYTGPNGQKVPLTVNEVLWMRRPDPSDMYGAVGAVQTVLTDIDASKYASEYNRNFFMNNGIPGGVLALDGSMTEPQFKEFSDEWRDQHMGVSRAHRVAVLENTKATFMMTGLAQRDMDYVNLIQNARDKMREAWRMHKHMLGTVDDVNRANAQTAEEIFAAWGITPRLERQKLTLNHQLLPLYGSLGEEIEFDYADPVPQNREADARELLGKSQAALWLVNSGFEPHAVLEAVGLPDMPAIELGEEGALPPRWTIPGNPDGGSREGGPDFVTPASPDKKQVKEARAAMMDMASRLEKVMSNGRVPVDLMPVL